jgi:hypothetical protein
MFRVTRCRCVPSPHLKRSRCRICFDDRMRSVTAALLVLAAAVALVNDGVAASCASEIKWHPGMVTCGTAQPWLQSISEYSRCVDRCSNSRPGARYPFRYAIVFVKRLLRRAMVILTTAAISQPSIAPLGRIRFTIPPPPPPPTTPPFFSAVFVLFSCLHLLAVDFMQVLLQPPVRLLFPHSEPVVKRRKLRKGSAEVITVI